MENKNDNQLKNIGWQKGFLTIAIGQTISIIGSSAVQFSLIWWLASETVSPLMMSLAGLLPLACPLKRNSEERFVPRREVKA
jgi:DHA3 family macrolide efflux protein-like MFS transporter